MGRTVGRTTAIIERYRAGVISGMTVTEAWTSAVRSVSASPASIRLAAKLAAIDTRKAMRTA